MGTLKDWWMWRHFFRIWSIEVLWNKRRMRKVERAVKGGVVSRKCNEGARLSA